MAHVMHEECIGNFRFLEQRIEGNEEPTGLVVLVETERVEYGPETIEHQIAHL